MRPLLPILLSALLLVTSPAAAAPAEPPAACDGWQQSVVGPADRLLAPVATWWSDGSATGQTGAASLRLTQPGPALILDFGRDVSGKLEVEAADASGAPVGLSTSESLQFLAPGGDTQAYGNGELVFTPIEGHNLWHAFARRTFRYALVRLLQAGWMQLMRIDTYFTAQLGPPSAFQGYFQSSDDVLNSIWYAGAYTLQLVSTAGSSSPSDGALEIWRGQLDMAAGRESRLLQAAGGSNWHDYTFDFDLALPPGAAGGGWVVRAAGDRFLGFRLAVGPHNGPSALQVWQGNALGSAALRISHELSFKIQPDRGYHIRVDAARTQVTTSIDGHVVSNDDAAAYPAGGIGFWATSGEQFDVAHPRVFGADGALLFEDAFDSGVYLDPDRWPGAPQPVVLDGAKRDRAIGVADLAISGRSGYLSFGDWNAVGSLLAAIGSRQYQDGKIPGGLVGDGSASPEDDKLPDYTLWWILAVDDYVLSSGDTGWLSGVFPRVQSALAWASGRRGADGLLVKGPGQDWYWSAQRGSGPTTQLNVLYVAALSAAASLAADLNLVALHDQYALAASDTSDAINARLWDPTVGAYVDGDLRDHHPLDANALAVLYGVAPAERATSALSFLHDRLWTEVGTIVADLPYGAWAQDGAVWPAYVAQEVEARFAVGDGGNALDLIRRVWGSMLSRDPASTFWEYALQDGSIHDGSTSLAHGWSTGAVSALSRFVLGVRPTAPGYRAYIVAPHPANLSWACGAVPTPSGPIRVAWQNTAGSLTVAVEAPLGSRGFVQAPAGASPNATLDGLPVQLVQRSPAELGLEDLPSGPHTVRFEIPASEPPLAFVAVP